MAGANAWRKGGFVIKNSLYAKYIKEREDADVIENEHGFLTYKVIGKELAIDNLYVDSNYRKSGCCFSLVQEVEEIAKKQRCEIITGTIHLIDPGANITVQAALRIGFKIHSANNNKIIIYKNISGGIHG